MLLFLRAQKSGCVTVLNVDSLRTGLALAKHSIPDEIQIVGHTAPGDDVGWFEDSPEFSAFAKRYSVAKKSEQSVKA